MTNSYFDRFKNRLEFKILAILLIALLVLKMGYQIGYAGYEFGQWLKAR